jgi:hypothetical protein
MARETREAERKGARETEGQMGRWERKTERHRERRREQTMTLSALYLEREIERALLGRTAS